LRDRATGAVVTEDGKPKIGWQPKPAVACASTVSPGLHVRLDSPLTRQCREGVTEFLLANHPLDCPICDQAGECRLQEYSADYGRGYSRYVDEKNRKPKKVRLGPRVLLDNERCILCARCIRFCKEIAKDPVLGFVNRGSRTMLACHPDRELANNYSLNTVDICPVGALTSVDFRFKMRVWFLKQTAAICTTSSVGVNTTIWSREGKIYRITPRQNDAVNDSWMPDCGRELYKQTTASDRLTTPLRHGVRTGAAEALASAVALLKAGAGKTAYVVSGQMTLEEQVLAADLAKATGAVGAGAVWMTRHAGENDGLLLSEDRTPNTRGALLAGLIDRLPDPDLRSLADALRRGAITTLLVFGEDITRLGVPAELLRTSGAKLIYLGIREDATAALADVALPVLTVFEKSGTFVNEQFRLQRFCRAVAGPDGVLSALEVLAHFIGAVGGETAESASVPLESLWRRLGDDTGPLNGIKFESIPEEGLLLDGSAWKDLPFPETRSLHYEGNS
jgi:NADH-quinone oxidoreductase subunit G